MTTDQSGEPPHPEEGTSPLEPVPMRPAPPPERRGRAGRDLPAAIAVGVSLAAAILVSLYVWKAAFVGVVLAAVLLGVWELSNALRAGGVRVPVVPAALCAVATLVAGYAGGPEPMLVAFVLGVLGVLVWRLPESPDGYIRDVSAGVLTIAYVPLLAGFALLMLRADDGPGRVVVFVLLTVLSDVGGFAAGVLFGRHPLAPAISPKKSWEGLAGSGVLAAGGGAVAVPLLLDASAGVGALVGLAVMATATLGDLGESMIKRDLGVKDMGALLPGHGGVMDRLDSLLPVAPVVYLMLSRLVPA